MAQNVCPNIEDWSQVSQVLKRLSSRAFASNEQFWRQQFCETCYAISEGGKDVFFREDLSEEDEKFFSQLIGLITIIICTVGDTLNQDELILRDISKLVIKYCLHHLKKKSEHLMLTSSLLVGILESMCKFQLTLTKDDMLPFQCEFLPTPHFLSDVKITVPSMVTGLDGVLTGTLDDNVCKVVTQQLLIGPFKTKIELRNELKTHNIMFLCKENGGQVMIDYILAMSCFKEMSLNYEKICDPDEDVLIIEAESISKLSGELRLLKEILSWSIMEPLTTSKVESLSVIVNMGLKAALFVASGRYKVEKNEVSLPNGTFVSSESYCRKYGWKTTEYALENLEIVGKMFQASTNLSGSILVNMQINCVYTILKGLKSILPSDTGEDVEVNAHTWKWFEGINIMLVTMTSRVILLLSTLIDELQLEVPTEETSVSTDSLVKFDLFKSRSAQTRLQLFMSSLHLPSLLLDLFLAAHGKGVKLSKLCQKLDESENAEKETTDSDEKKQDSSEGESSTEEGSMLGSFFVQAITNPEQKSAEEEEKEKEKQKEDVFAQSSEIFFLLASSLLDFTSKLFAICESKDFKDEIRSAFTKNRLAIFAKLMKNDSFDKEDISQHLTKLISGLITEKVLDKESLDMLLSTFQILPEKTSPWPTKLGKYILPLFARVAFTDVMENRGQEMNLTYCAWLSLLQSIRNVATEGKEDYTNAEYLQLMILIFHFLPEEKKKILFGECASLVISLKGCKLKSSIHLSRLVLIFNYMLSHCFGGSDSHLLRQVQSNLMMFETGKETPLFVPSRFNEEDIIKKFTKQCQKPNSSSQLENGQNNPLFYMLKEAEDVVPDAIALQCLTESNKFTYTSWFQSYMTLMTELISQVDDVKSKDLYAYLGIRHAFLTMWSSLKIVPVPADQFVSMNKLIEGNSDVDYIFYLHWMPKLFDLNKGEIESNVNIIFSSEEKENELKKVLDTLHNFDGKPSEIIAFGKKLLLLFNDMYKGETSFLSGIISDGLIMFLWLLLKKYVFDQEEPLEGSVEELNDLVLGLIRLLKIAVEKSKEMVIKGGYSKQPDDLDENKLHFYMDIIGADLPIPTESSNNQHSSGGIHMKVLPVEVKEALVKWNQLEVSQSIQLIPTLFQGVEVKKGENSNQLRSLVSSCVHSVIKSHLDINNFEALHMIGAASLKRFIRTLTDICVEVLPWIHTNHGSQFSRLKAAGLSTFSGFSIDYVAAHISMHTETLTFLCLDDPGKDRIELVGFINMLEIIDKWMLKEFLVGGMVEEKVLICWLQFMCALMDYSKTQIIFTQYFKQNPDFLFEVQKSIISPLYSTKYLAEIVEFITKLLQLGEKIVESDISSSLLKIFSEDTPVLTSFIEKLIFSSEKEIDGCNLLRLLIELAIQKEYSTENCLSTLMHVLSSTINAILNDDVSKLPAKFLFNNLFEIVVNLAMNHGKTGLFSLLPKAIEWLQTCYQLWPIKKQEGKISNRFYECCNALISFINKMISTLSIVESNESVSEEVMLKRDVFDMVDFADPQVVPTEDSVGEESDDDSVAGKVCTFTVTQRDFMNQHWYHCHTCKMSDGVGCCTVCAKVCHKGHEVSYSKHGSFFCDCGAKGDGSCKAMSNASTAKPTFTSKQKVASDGKPLGEQMLKVAGEPVPEYELGDDGNGSFSSQDEDIFLIRKILKDSKSELRKLLKDSCIFDTILSMLQKANDDFSAEVVSVKDEIKKQKEDVVERLSLLYTLEKSCSLKEDLVTPTWHSQDGVFENIKLNYGGDQGQTLRQLMVAHAIHYKPICLINSARRQQFVLTHEKGKITIFQLAGLLNDQPDGILKKTAINRMLSALMPFTVLHMASNPANDDFLAISGLKDCHVLILDQAGSVPSRLALSPKLETGNFIIKVVWLPNSQTKLALLTADFVKIYDLSKSETTAIHHFVPPNGKMRDLTFIESNSNVYVTVMSSQGYIYTEVLSSASSTGPFYMMNVLPVEHPQVEETGQGLLNEGGASLYYSNSMKLLFFSYSAARSFVGALDQDISCFSKIFMINTQVTTHSPLVQWSDVTGQPGAVCCFQQNTGNIILMNVKADSILVQEIKSSTKSTKVHSALSVHHQVTDAGSASKPTSAITLLVLLEDGSIQAHKGAVKSDFVVPERPTMSASKIVEIVGEKKSPQIVKIDKNKSRSNTKFPIDFFEHCQVTNDIEYGGSDILHVYNSSQVMNRLKIAGWYIANTKPSGFKMDITNKDPSNVIVGLRIQVGVQAMERSPQYVEILGRVTQMQTAKNRWFDVPLTREESLKICETNKVVIKFGPSNDPYGLSMVDSIKVYVQTKEAFGFPQANDSQQNTEATKVSGAVVETKKQCSFSEILLASLLCTVKKCFKELAILENQNSVSSLINIASNLITIDPQYFGDSSIVGYQAHCLLHNLFPDDAKFYTQKDEIQVSHMVGIFKAAKDEADLSNGVVDVGAFELILKLALSTGNARAENLVRFIASNYNVTEFANSIIKLFWNLHDLVPDTPHITVPDSTVLSSLVEMIVEILFALMLGDKENIVHMAKLMIDLLLVKDLNVSSAAKRGLIKALQSRRKLNIDIQKVEKSTSKIKESKENKKENCTDTTSASSSSQDTIAKNVLLSTQDVVVEIEERMDEEEDRDEDDEDDEDEDEDEDDDDGIVMDEGDIMSSGDLQMLLDDDNSVMEIALALSLQGHEESMNQEADDQELPLLRDGEGEDCEEDEEEDDDDDDDDEEEEEEEYEDELVTYDEQQEQTPDVDEGDADEADLSDVGTACFSESSVFVCLPSMISSDKLDASYSLLWNHLLKIFKDKIPELLELNGFQVIPFFQVLLILCSNLRDSEEEKQMLRGVIVACVEPLGIDDQSNIKVGERSSGSEVKLVLMRFLSVLMSRSNSNKQAKEDENPTNSFDAHAAKLLSEFGLIDHCLFLLKSLHSYWEKHKSNEDFGPVSEKTHLLKMKPNFSIPDMMPFFMEQYVKSHAFDLFEAYPQLLTEMVLRVPYQIHKLIGASTEGKYFSKDWTYVLCEYMLTPHTPLVRRQVRKLLLALCGSKEKYRFIKDLHNLRSHLSHVRELLHHSGIGVNDAPKRNIFLSYEDTVSLTENVSACIEIASSRIENWQSFCKKEKAILPFLLQASYQVTDHISSKIIELINSSLTVTPKKREKQEKKETSAIVCTELVRHLFVQCFGSVLTSFMQYFLLESNSSQLRWKAHSLIHTIYLNTTPEQQSQLVESMWTLWENIPSYGHRASQIVDLLGYFTLNTSYVGFQKKIPDFVNNVITMLKEGNECLVKHPNGSLYRKLKNFVELDGFYIESDPCVICNDPEVTHNNYKLSSLKSDIRYSTTAQIIKLVASHTVYKINLKISDIKRAKMVKTINFSYNNKPVPSAVELKNKPEIWQKARKISLAQGQTDVKVELTFPITACNLMVEFVEFYDNAQFSSETLQCPRCSASVPAHPGICSNCGENVFQCHKCRAINYDERDPFLCTSCGFCKYAKFEFVLSAHPCCSVESIHSEEDRDKALKTINSSLEKADQYYKQLTSHREALEKLLNMAGTGDVSESGSSPGNIAWNVSALNTPATATTTPATAMPSINQSIQVLAQRYCVDCKTAFDEMSKVTQTIMATRRELRLYDMKQQEALSQAMYSGSDSCLPTSSSFDEQFSLSCLPSFASSVSIDKSSALSINRCYGCALSAVYHCLTLLRAFATMSDTHQLMLDHNLMQELVEHNLQQRTPDIISLTKALLIKLSKSDREANVALNNIICNRIRLCLTTRASNVVLEISLRNELSVMKESIACGDYLWEERFRCIFKLFMESLQQGSPEVVESITLPCLEIINSCMKTVLPDNQKVIPMNKPKQPAFPANAIKWLNQTKDASFGVWKFSLKGLSQDETRNAYLMKKYGLRWLQSVRKKKSKDTVSLFSATGWLRLLLFTPSSSETRKMICVILENLAKYPAKKQMLLHLFMSYLDELHSAGENSAEYLKLFKDMLSTSASKVYLCRFGILDKLFCLLSKEIEFLSSQESSTYRFDLAQGFALFSLAELLKSFLDDSEVILLYQGRFVAEVLQGYLALRKLVVQRTKFIDETQEMLLSLLRQLSSGTEESAFMKTCTDALKKCPVNDVRTPVFIFEQLCNVIHKEEEERTEFFMLLEKDPQQEDYLQGRMQGNPYSSKEPGLSPLMRDIKNKICTECELVALLEDDTGMELLINNKIISLDLPVDEVYRKIWCNGKGDSKEPMKVIYRMRGLLGDATEDMIENLNSNKDEDVDEENEYQRAKMLTDTGGLEVVLKRLSCIRDLSRAQPLVSVILKLLEYCIKVKAVRKYINKPSVNAMKIMLQTLNIALRTERDYGSTSGGAAIAERVLKVMEIILQEATADADLNQVALPGEEIQLELLLNHITISYVQSNPNVLQAMMRLTSFLTFGSKDNMNKLIDHFLPFFDFENFDKDKSSDVVLHLDCFCMICDSISASPSSSQLKDMIIKKDVISKVMNYLHSHTPPKSLRASGILDTAKWKDFLAKPSLPYILRMLTGLINGHTPMQTIIAADEHIELLHNLEQVSSEEMVGSLAENLLEVLKESPVGKEKVNDVRKQTRDEKKQLAMAMRQKQLESLGMTVTPTGHIKSHKALAAVKEISELQEEKDQRLVCCICREGYKFYPTKVMGIYTFTSRCVLDDFENKPKRMQGYSTVSHFNVIHFDCHTEGVRHARSRDEWESAALQNGNTKCNGLLPMWGSQVSESSFAACLARHNSYLQECTGFREPTFHSTVHDIKLMLIRFAHQKSFSKDTGGGGKLSNMFLLPYMIHMALYVLNTTRQHLVEEQLIKTFCDAPVDSWIGTCYEVNGPLFATVLNIFVSPMDTWKTQRKLFLKRLILLAHVRKLSAVPMNTLMTNDTKEYAVYKPFLMFYSLVDQLHSLCKAKIPSSEDWPQEMSNYLRNNDHVVLKGAEKILQRFEEDVLPCESFTEFCDVQGLLEEIPEPDTFIKNVLNAYCVDSTEVFC